MPDPQTRPWNDLRNTGLLWLINRVVFHPRGYALALIAEDDGTITGWRLVGNGHELWEFERDTESAMFEAAQAILTPAPAEPPSMAEIGAEVQRAWRDAHGNDGAS